MEPTRTYRADIDGIRAIAVLSVVFYHLEYAAFPGGFTGVDIFFVISGFLITGIIRRELSAGQFSVARFYERRARRILPALIIVILACLTAGYLTLLPSDFERLGAQASAAVLGVSNIYYYLTTGYFDRASDVLPLLHTWSLGVEEQFYLVWPLLLLIAAGAKPRGTTAFLVGGVATAGFIIAIVVTARDPMAAFYLLPARAWELALGGLIALQRPLAKAGVAQVARLIGLALIGYSIFGLDSTTAFPGFNAIYACAGAALLLWPATHNTVVAQMLGLRPFAFVGLISYSLYLWHWPLIAFVRLTDPFEQLPPDVRLPLLGIAIVLSVATYYLVERPFRRRLSGRRPVVLFIAALAMFAIASVGAFIYWQNGLPSRVPEQVTIIAAAERDSSPFRRACHRGGNDSIPVSESCILGADVIPTTAVWGDSHGMEIGTALSERLEQEGNSLIIMTASACPPAVDFDVPRRPACLAYNREVLDFLLASEGISEVFMVARYEYYRRYDWDTFADGFIAAVSALEAAGKTVSVFTPIPLAPYSVPQAAAKLAMFAPDTPIEIPYASYATTNERVFEMLSVLQSATDAIILDVASVICSQQSCPLLRDGRPLYFDEDHLSMYGARLVVDALVGSNGTGSQTVR